MVSHALTFPKKPNRESSHIKEVPNIVAAGVSPEEGGIWPPGTSAGTPVATAGGTPAATLKKFFQ